MINPLMPRAQMVKSIARLGYFVVPFTLDMPTKPRKPVIPYSGQTQTAADVDKLCERYADLDWAVRVPQGVVVIDIESRKHGGHDGFKAWADLGGRLDGMIGVMTRNGGRHLYFRTHKEHRAGYIADGVEIKPAGSTCHVPPSKDYKWMPSPFCSPDVLPLAPEWLPVAKKSTVDVTDDIIPEGKRRHALCSVLGKVRNAGLNGNELAAVALAFRQRFADPSTFTEEEALAVAKDFATKEICGYDIGTLAESGDTAAQSVIAQWATKFGYLRHAARDLPAAPISHDADARDPVWKPTLPDPGGLLSRAAQWANSTNTVAQPDLHLFATIATAGAIIGPRLQFEGTKSNLYGICVASSGRGKQRVRLSCMEILKSLGREGLIGPECGSGDGFMNQLRESSSKAFIWDEFGENLEGMYSKNAPPYLLHLRTCLKEGFSGGDMRGKALKDSVGGIVRNPHVSLLGFVQPTVYARCINRRNIEDGMIARFVAVEESEIALRQRPARPNPPDTLLAELKEATKDWTVLNAEPESPADIQCSPGVLSLASRIDSQLWQAAEERAQRDPYSATLMRRSCETFKKLALIHGAWNGRCVTKESVDWAYTFTTQAQRVSVGYLDKSTRSLENMPDWELQMAADDPKMAARQNLLLRYMSDKKICYMTALRAVGRSWARPSVEEVVSQLVAARAVQVIGMGKHRGKEVYAYSLMPVAKSGEEVDPNEKEPEHTPHPPIKYKVQA